MSCWTMDLISLAVCRDLTVALASTMASAGLRCSACKLRRAWGQSFPHEQSFGFIVPHVIIPLVASTAVGFSQLLPAVGRIDRATELIGIDKGFGHQYRMAIAILPVLAQTR